MLPRLPELPQRGLHRFERLFVHADQRSKVRERLHPLMLVVFSSDVDECATQRGLCRYGKCVNSLGSFWCVCNEGYELALDGRVCTGECLPSLRLWKCKPHCFMTFCSSSLRYKRMCSESRHLWSRNLSEHGRYLQVYLPTWLLPPRGNL